MPYFLYRVAGPRQLTQLAVYQNYKEAREEARGRRAEEGAGSVNQIRIMFARNEAEAEALLNAPKEERYIDEG
jgi:hypothetical protein